MRKLPLVLGDKNVADTYGMLSLAQGAAPSDQSLTRQNAVAGNSQPGVSPGAFGRNQFDAPLRLTLSRRLILVPQP